MLHAFAYRHSSDTSTPTPTPAATDDIDYKDSNNKDKNAAVVEPGALEDALPGVSETVLAEDFPLYLPSALPSDLLHSTSPDLIDKEIQVRLTVLEATFHELLRLLTVKMGIINNKRSFVVGQKGNTRAQTLLAGFVDKIDYTSEKYRQVCSALSKLDPQGQWSTRLKPLLKTDVRMPQEDDDPEDKKQQRKAKKKKDLGEGSRKPSWIWCVSDMTTEVGQDDALLGDGELLYASE